MTQQPHIDHDELTTDEIEAVLRLSRDPHVLGALIVELPDPHAVALHHALVMQPG